MEKMKWVAEEGGHLLLPTTWMFSLSWKAGITSVLEKSFVKIDIT